MWQYVQYNELYHYGILGMKWGVRRYQNEDGSLTEAGKKKYADGTVSGERRKEIQLKNKYYIKNKAEVNDVTARRAARGKIVKEQNKVFTKTRVVSNAVKVDIGLKLARWMLKKSKYFNTEKKKKYLSMGIDAARAMNAGIAVLKYNDINAYNKVRRDEMVEKLKTNIGFGR